MTIGLSSNDKESILLVLFYWLNQYLDTLGLVL